MAKKQPVKIILTKEDLSELFGVLKKFIEEELFRPYRLDLNHRMELLQRRIKDVEKTTNAVGRVSACPHQDRFDSIWYSPVNNKVYGLKYRCTMCGRERVKTSVLLSRKEKRALRKILGEGII